MTTYPPGRPVPDPAAPPDSLNPPAPPTPAKTAAPTPAGAAPATPAGASSASGGGSATNRLRGERLTLGYDRRIVTTDLDVRIPDGEFTVIVGPNACGKSTLLRALARMLRPRSGTVHLDGAAISAYPTKEVARRLGLLPQTPVAPGGITAADLVARGRYPHQRLLRQWSRADEAAVGAAMRLTGVTDLADRFVDELSGGQRQRVWLAMVLAQQTPILLLDEPTTFLDLAHQVEVLDLCADLHEQGHTLVAVLHDLNQACRYASHLIAMSRDGRIAAEGDPTAIVTRDLVQDVFGLRCRVISDPETGTPLIVPARRG
ncbi:MAG TPA: ABC transporter ATP-binding protein [Mycobacteriales bacterium]|nr:ABC transporter ATP-binding protein [Mycobacteriales bacterium]